MTFSDYLLSTSREYAIYVCSTRAIPNVQDGLKHGQRIALWLLRNRADKIKTVALGGMMSAERLYVHGDVSATNAIGLLAAPYKNNVPLIEGLGQFGSRVAPVDGIGAPRYTEVRRSKAAEAFLYNDIDLVPLRDNYDGSNKEPIHFLPLIPTVLLNGVQGVAVGWSTKIFPRSLKGLIQATQDALKGAKTIRGLEPHFERYNIEIRNKGDNKYEFVGKVEIINTSTVRVTELPPGIAIEDFRAMLIQMEEEEAIQSFTDRSTDTIDITIRFKRGSIAGWNEEKVIDFLKLKERSTERIVVINWDGVSIRTYENAETLVREFAQWRLGWYTKRFEKLLAEATYERTYWRLLKALFDGGFTKKLGTFKDRDAMASAVLSIATKSKLQIDDAQLNRVLNLATYRWTMEFEAEVTDKIKSLDTAIADYKATLADDEKLKAVYMSELEALKKLK
jgi:Type IIA topoisomerase (DNA gyrase/topo II, topoisomerase IV), A subunit